MSYVSVGDAENEHKGDVEEEMAEYRGVRNTVKHVLLLVVIVVVLVVLAIVFKDHFSDFADFVGTSCITANCILLPIVFYLVKASHRIPMSAKKDARLSSCSFSALWQRGHCECEPERRLLRADDDNYDAGDEEDGDAAKALEKADRTRTASLSASRAR
ncbi:hypothetical protein PF010_g27165 [Phytophthora fragariae]|nr:hypothetical protein PF009_g27170 [Phytophthora fragariae]KAE8972925.1 hypothetical protein PF011_g25462 [Phytophthora fragariae]KAE9068174.1 hypothetical protein PF010_g27165 [Phytophthora fragariae]KAE9068874.1 hypothetical protein PF007_g27526 [Phytophthora fragariae]